MNIQKIQSNTSFKSWQREVYKKTQSGMITELKHRNDTWFYRGSFDYNYFPKFLEEFFQNVEKVNTYFYGCSDGSDAYSFMMPMILQLKEKAMKYFPIKALDYDNDAIQKAKYGLLNIENDEKDKIEYYTNKKMSDFLENKKDKLYKPKSILSDNIIFKNGDITKDYRKIKPNNTILAARNFWPYLEIEDRRTLAQKLYNHMGEKSLLIVGEYDLQEWDVNLNSMLYKIGWEPTYLNCVFQKGKPHPEFHVY